MAPYRRACPTDYNPGMHTDIHGHPVTKKVVPADDMVVDFRPDRD